MDSNLEFEMFPTALVIGVGIGGSRRGDCGGELGQGVDDDRDLCIIFLSSLYCLGAFKHRKERLNLGVVQEFFLRIRCLKKYWHPGCILYTSPSNGVMDTSGV